MKIAHVLTFLTLLGLISCNRSDYKKLPSGLKYWIVESHTGPKAKIGDFLKMQIKTTVGDSVLIDTHSIGPRDIPLQKGEGRFDVMEGLAMLSAGDSAIFLIPADSVMKAPQRPPFVKKGDTISIHVRVLAIQTSADRMKEDQQASSDQLSKDNAQIMGYLTAHHLSGTPTKLGVYVVTEKAGKGPNPKVGQIVSINYTGKLLDGQVFDSNLDTNFHHAGKPLTFPVGIGEMIRGMDDAMMVLNKGTNATLYIPSGLGYGAQAPPAIGPNAILVFDVEVLDIKDAPKNSQQGSLPPPSGN
jgi:FKBP-type peptidyl-prolyl cis-trans isomerase FkpA